MRVLHVFCLCLLTALAHELRAQDSLGIPQVSKDLAIVDSFARPQQVIFTMIKGQIKTFKNKAPVQAKLRVIETQSYAEMPYVYSPDTVDGRFFMLLPPQKNYKIYIETDGFEAYTFDLHVPARTYYIDLQKDIYFDGIYLLGSPIGQQAYEKNALQKVIKLYDETNALEKVKYDFMVEFIDHLVSYENQESMATASVALEKEADPNEATSDENEQTDTYYDPLVSLIDSAMQLGDIKFIEDLLSKVEDAPRQKVFFFEDKSEEVILANSQNNIIQKSSRCLAKHVLLFEPKQTKLSTKQKHQMKEIIGFLNSEEGTALEVSATINPDNEQAVAEQIKKAQARAWQLSKFLNKNIATSEKIAKVSFGADCLANTTNRSLDTDANLPQMQEVHIYVIKKFGYDVHE